MTTLSRYDQDGLELAINNETGEVFASISAVARMTDKQPSLIEKNVNGKLKSVSKMTLVEAKLATTQGLRAVSLLNEDQILELVSKYKPTLLMQFAKVGLRLGLQQLVGYKVTSELPGEAKFKVEGFLKIKNDCLVEAKKKAYNETQGENAFNMMNGYLRNDLGFQEDYTTALGATKTALMYSLATNRLMKEEDKSLQQNHQYNLMVKAGRHGVVSAWGQEAIPYSSYPKVEQKLIDAGKSPLENKSSAST